MANVAARSRRKAGTRVLPLAPSGSAGASRGSSRRCSSAAATTGRSSSTASTRRSGPTWSSASASTRCRRSSSSRTRSSADGSHGPRGCREIEQLPRSLAAVRRATPPREAVTPSSAQCRARRTRSQLAAISVGHRLLQARGSRRRRSTVSSSLARSSHARRRSSELADHGSSRTVARVRSASADARCRAAGSAPMSRRAPRPRRSVAHAVQPSSTVTEEPSFATCSGQSSSRLPSPSRGRPRSREIFTSRARARARSCASGRCRSGRPSSPSTRPSPPA